MPSSAGAEHTIHSRIGEIKQRDQPIVVDFEKPSGEHQVLTFESYVTRADLKAALRSEGLAMLLGVRETSDSELDKLTGADLVKVKRLGFDDSDFMLEFEPGNPAADDKGFVKMPNVNILIEMADMREANRTYDANLQTVKQTRELISATIDLLKASQ